jgi:hypothetical protein
MNRNLMFRTITWIFLITGLVIQACRGIPESVTTITPSATLSPSAITPSNGTQEACGFVWAYKDLADLSNFVQDTVQALQPKAKARAQAFGEDCVYSNGKSEFHALETDFYVTLMVDDLLDEDELGNWITRIMPEIIRIPQDKLLGPKEGFCEFKFTDNTNEVVIVRVPLEQFRMQGNGLEGAELYRLFGKKP